MKIVVIFGLSILKIYLASEILPPLFELLSGNKGFESFSSALQISRKWFNFQQKFAWFQTVEDANNWYFERKFSGPNFVWTLADIGNCIVFFSFNFAKLYHIYGSLRILSRDLLTPKSVTTHHSRHHISSVVISRKFQGTFSL